MAAGVAVQHRGVSVCRVLCSVASLVDPALPHPVMLYGYPTWLASSQLYSLPCMAITPAWRFTCSRVRKQLGPEMVIMTS